MRKVLAASAAGLMLAFGLAFTANSAMAGTADHYPDAGWRLIDTAADGTRSSSTDSTVTSTTVQLVRKSATVGTSMETEDLDLSVSPGDKLTVDYAVSDEATTAAGAIRMFVYGEANADTMKDAPRQVAIADADSGKLMIEINAAGKIGTFGLVYDSSNASTGMVKFSDLKLDGQKVLFVKPLIVVTPTVVTEGENVSAATCEADGKLALPEVTGVKYTRTPATGTGEVKVTATAEEGYKLAEGNWVWTVSVPAKLPADSEQCKKPTQSPTPSPTTSSPTPRPTTSNPGNGGGGTQSPTVTPSQSSDAAAPPMGNSGNELPLTGPGKGGLIATASIGVLMFAVGGILLVLLRRRRDADAVESA